MADLEQNEFPTPSVLRVFASRMRRLIAKLLSDESGILSVEGCHPYNSNQNDAINKFCTTHGVKRYTKTINEQQFPTQQFDVESGTTVKARFTYRVTFSLSLVLLLVQIIIGCTIASIGTDTTHQDAITILGAINAALASVLALLKSTQWVEKSYKKIEAGQNESEFLRACLTELSYPDEDSARKLAALEEAFDGMQRKLKKQHTDEVRNFLISASPKTSRAPRNELN